MRDEILASHRSSAIRVYAVWFPVLAGDRSGTVARLFNDPRVTSFWDPQRRVGDWFSAQVTNQSGITWDAYFLFGADATWDRVPAPVARSGSPVIGSRDDLAAALKELSAGN